MTMTWEFRALYLFSSSNLCFVAVVVVFVAVVVIVVPVLFFSSKH